MLVAKDTLALFTSSLTIPRLELMAVFIGVRLMNAVSQALELHRPNTLYWSDSIDVLC